MELFHLFGYIPFYIYKYSFRLVNNKIKSIKIIFRITLIRMVASVIFLAHHLKKMYFNEKN